jgi:hypothetical protein
MNFNNKHLSKLFDVPSLSDQTTGEYQITNGRLAHERAAVLYSTVYMSSDIHISPVLFLSIGNNIFCR